MNALRRALRRVFCAIDGHHPQLDRIESLESHYPHPCWCGAYLGEHLTCDCPGSRVTEPQVRSTGEPEQ